VRGIEEMSPGDLDSGDIGGKMDELVDRDELFRPYVERLTVSRTPSA